jgi:hypothetical protein
MPHDGQVKAPSVVHLRARGSPLRISDDDRGSASVTIEPLKTAEHRRGNALPTVDDLVSGAIVRGSILPEAVKVIAILPMGDATKVIGEGLTSGQVHQPILTAGQIAELEVSPEKRPFDGDAHRFRLGVEAMRLGLAYEYDPYFSLSIARVDPLPHQLEAVFHYFLRSPRIRSPRIRFLLADDPGAGKTIMAGLLIKEHRGPYGAAIAPSTPEKTNISPRVSLSRLPRESWYFSPGACQRSIPSPNDLRRLAPRHVGLLPARRYGRLVEVYG